MPTNQDSNLTQTANGYLLCERHARAWREGGNTVAMWPLTQSDYDYAMDEFGSADCADCRDEADAKPATPAALARKWGSRPVDTPESARSFLAECCSAIGAGFHPDDRMAGYVNYPTDAPTFPAPADAEALDRRVDEAFTQLGDDVYAVCLDEIHAMDGRS